MPNINVAVSSGPLKIDPQVLKLIPQEIMRRYRLLPLRIQEGKLYVAVDKAIGYEEEENVRTLTGYDIEVIRVDSSEFEAAMRRCCGDLAEHPHRPDLEREALVKADVFSSGRPPAYAVAAVDALIVMAVQMRASDIHLEPQGRVFIARFRVDGVLRTIHEFAKADQEEMTARLKIMAGMDISEKRLPQDGKISLQRADRTLDLRVSSLPSKYGEKIVIRILEKSGGVLRLDHLGFDSAMQGTLESLIEKPNGLILVTGPTGSGKTTTLYAVLNRLKSPFKNVVTLEDPIEYELLSESSNEMGITQVQVNPRIGLTFAAGLRASLRQDPDIIMVGEIRDKETAETAMAASMTGHLVMSTLHTNDAPGALSRLIDIGVQPYLISATVIGCLAQRLVRMLCSECKEAYRPPPKALERLFPGHPDLRQAKFFRAHGCAHCQGTGYWGRQGVFELLIINEDIKKSINAGASTQHLAETMRSTGSKSLRESGMGLVLQGLTSVDEVFRVTVE